MKLTRRQLRRLILQEANILKEGRTVNDLSSEEIFSLTRNTFGENYIEQFEGALVDILGDLVPELSDEAVSRITRNSSEHQQNLKSLIDRRHSVESAGREFIEELVNMAKKLS